MFIAALLVIAKTGYNPNVLQWINEQTDYNYHTTIEMLIKN